MLGYLYEDGKGVTADGNEAAKWYKQAADAGVIEARKASARCTSSARA